MISCDNIVFGLLTAAGITSVCLGQVREDRVLASVRGFSNGRCRAADVGELVDSQFTVREGRLLVLRVERRTLVVIPGEPLLDEGGFFDIPIGYTDATGVDIAGDHHGLGAPSHLLISGRTTGGVGRVEEWKFDGVAKAMVLVGGASYANRDFSGVAYDSGQSRIFLLDCVSRELLVASWMPGAPFPAAASFTVLADASNVPVLTTAADRMIRFVQSGNGGVPVSSAGMIFIGDFYSDPGPGFFLDESTVPPSVFGGVYYDPLHYRTGPQPDQTTAQEGGSTVIVRAKAGELVMLADLQDGTVVGADFIPEGASSVMLNLNSPLEIGNVYEAANPFDSNVIGGTFECVARYGSPTSGRISFPVREAETDAIIGNSDFYVRTRVAVSPPPSVPTELVGAWMLGAYREGGVDPLTSDPFGGSNPVVVPLAVLEATGLVFEDGSGSMRFSLPLPNDPSLVGEVLLTQFAALDAGFLRFSPIIGQKLRAR